MLYQVVDTRYEEVRDEFYCPFDAAAYAEALNEEWLDENSWRRIDPPFVVDCIKQQPNNQET
jgi:hypothetical protein